MMAHLDLKASPPEDQGDEVAGSRDLVKLIFRAVLHRDPAESDAAAFTHALMSGMPIYDFVSELMATPEFQTPVAPVPDPPASTLPLPEAVDTSYDMTLLSLGLLQARLIDKGCQFQLGPVPGDCVGQAVDATRMERVVRTLAMLDVL